MENIRSLTGVELNRAVTFVFRLVTNIGSYLQATARKEHALVLTLELVEVAKLLPPGECRDSGIATAYKSIGLAFSLLSDFKEAIKYTEMSVAIQKEIPNYFHKDFRWSTYRLLGTLYKNAGDLKRARESLEQALDFASDTLQKVQTYKDLCDVYLSLGNDEKAAECMKRSTDIIKGEVPKELAQKCLVGEGGVFLSRGEPRKAIACFKEALTISEEMGGRNEQCRVNQVLGRAYDELDDLENALIHHERALSLAKELGHKDVQADQHVQIIRASVLLGDEEKAKESLEVLVALSENLQHKSTKISSSLIIGSMYERANDLKKAIAAYEKTYKHCEDLKDLLENEDDDKVYISDKLHEAYRSFSRALVNDKQHLQALTVADRGKARALADMMSLTYGIQFSSAPQTQTLTAVEIEQIARMGCGSDILFTSINVPMVYVWHLAPNGNITLRQKEAGHKQGKVKDYIKSKVDKFYNEIGVTQDEANCEDSIVDKVTKDQVNCEDRSLPFLHPEQPKSKSRKKPESGTDALWENIQKKKSSATDSTVKIPDPTKTTSTALTVLYDLLIAPVADLIQDYNQGGTTEELVFVPDGHFSFVPFTAIKGPDGKCLAEKFRIRVIPSLATLNHIRISPASYHSNTGALIVGDPDVGNVQYKGKTYHVGKLPWAKREVEMIGRLLNVEPLVADKATKHEVLNRLRSVSLVHLAAHGNPERGEIALAPVHAVEPGLVQEKDYLLSMADVMNTGVRANLVVLSCCHSGRGDIKAEGVIGIARAFLAAGARSVLVSLWAIDDEATMCFMQYFYEGIVRGNSASTALHQATKKMKNSGAFNETKYWAPFLLIGDDVHVSV